VKDLNQWKNGQLDEFMGTPTQEDMCLFPKKRPASKLMDYGVPGGNGGKTLIYNDFLDKDSKAKVLDEANLLQLKSGEIKTIVVGHRPHMDSPYVMKSGYKDNEVTIVTADTS